MDSRTTPDSPRLIINLQQFIPMRNPKWATVFGRKAVARTAYTSFGKNGATSHSACRGPDKNESRNGLQGVKKAPESYLQAGGLLFRSLISEMRYRRDQFGEEEIKRELSNPEESSELSEPDSSSSVTKSLKQETPDSDSGNKNLISSLKELKDSGNLKESEDMTVYKTVTPDDSEKDAFADVPDLNVSHTEALFLSMSSASLKKELEKPKACICNRPSTTISCPNCGQTRVGRVRRICPAHPKRLYLMDVAECWKCRNSKIVELD